LTHRSLDHPIQTTGHGDIVQDPNGNWWIVFLGTRPWGYPRYHILGRETFLAPVMWQDQWPIIGNSGTVELEMEASLPDPQPWDMTEPLLDEFDTGTLGMHWNWVRNPIKEHYSLSSRPGWLRLSGTAITLDEEASPTFIGRRQRHIKCRFTTKTEFNPQEEHEEAGLVAFADNRHHYEIAVSFKNNERVILVRRRIGTLQAIVALESIPNGQLQLAIECDPTWYTFRYATKEQPWKALAKGETRYLCTEAGAAMFTGVYFGMYATGNGKACTTPADFDWCQYKVLGKQEKSSDNEP
jgi:alpha-N-arabinofuranosidase